MSQNLGEWATVKQINTCKSTEEAALPSEIEVPGLHGGD